MTSIKGVVARSRRPNALRGHLRQGRAAPPEFFLQRQWLCFVNLRPRPEPDLLNRSFFAETLLRTFDANGRSAFSARLPPVGRGGGSLRNEAKTRGRGARKSRNGFAYRDKCKSQRLIQEKRDTAMAKPTLGPYRRCGADSGRCERRDEAAKRSYTAWRFSSFLLARSCGRQKGSQIAQLRRHPGSPWDRNIAQRWQSA
jgi:hypothetical protein